MQINKHVYNPRRVSDNQFFLLCYNRSVSWFNLCFYYFTRVLACLLIPFSVLQGRCECLETETNGTTEVLTALITATMSKNVELNSIPLEPSVHVINQSVNPTSDHEDAVQADGLQYEDVRPAGHS